MSKEFKYTTSKGQQVEVYFDVECDSSEEAFPVDLAVFDPKTNETIQLENLAPVDAITIESRAEAIANETAYELYYEKMMARAEAWGEGER